MDPNASYVPIDEEEENNADSYSQGSFGMRKRNNGSGRTRSTIGTEEPSAPHSLEERHQMLNQLFGIKPFSHHVAKRPFESRSEIVKQLYEPPLKAKDSSRDLHLSITIPNVLWTIFFGWWLSLVYIIISGLLFITIVGIPYAKWCWQLKTYFFWPFGKYIVREKVSRSEEQALLRKESTNYEPEKHSASVTEVMGRIVWYIIAVPWLTLFHTWSFIFCWLPVISIPMAKVNREAIRLLFASPLELSVSENYPGASADVILCTHVAVNLYYYKYSVGGMNIIFVNFLPFVVLTLIMGYLIPHALRPRPTILFFTALLSIIPLSYYIGMAVSSISAQTNFAVGALLNATFGSVVELIINFTAIKFGASLNELVQYTVTGSLLSTMLFLPGISMVFGGLKYKEQRFNPLATGVSSVLLFISIIGAFTPTIYYHSWGTYTLSCTNCEYTVEQDAHPLSCSGCTYEQIKFDLDPHYTHGARPLMYACSIILPIAYIIGLIFTLKTHAYIFEPDPNEQHGGHDAPEWSKFKSIAILLVATTLFALISEQLVDSLEPALETLGLNQAFVGVFFLGTIANTAEIVNAVNFALKDNIALSIEIGASGTIQAALIQMPALVFFSAILNHESSVNSFTLIFPTLNLFAIIFGVILVNYVYISGKTNYFEGASLLLVYALLVLAFFYVPNA